MDIQDAMRELLDEPRGEQAHVSGEADEIDIVLLEPSDDFSIMLLAGFSLRWKDEGVQSAAARGFDAGSISAV